MVFLPKKRKIEELLGSVEEYLDYVSVYFNDIKEEWLDYNIVTTHEDAEQQFSCNHCGKCCSCAEYAIEVYPSDIEEWLQEERYDIVCAITPMIDENDVITLGFPSQHQFHEAYLSLLDEKGIDNSIKQSIKRIYQAILNLNKGFNISSDYCIFYNEKNEKHCSIYETPPFSCQAYPYDLRTFTSINIPDNLKEKYQIFEEELDEEPLCPSSCFSKSDRNLPTKCSDDDKLAVVIDRANYLAQSVLDPDLNDGVVELLIEAFSNYIKSAKTPADRRDNEAKQTAGVSNRGGKGGSKKKSKQNAAKKSHKRNKKKKSSNSSNRVRISHSDDKKSMTMSFSGPGKKKSVKKR